MKLMCIDIATVVRVAESNVWRWLGEDFPTV
jgi:hypothetical protein